MVADDHAFARALASASELNHRTRSDANETLVSRLLRQSRSDVVAWAADSRRRLRSTGVDGVSRFPSTIRVSLNGAPLLWARVEDEHYGYELLRAPGAAVDAGTLGIIPPISSELIRRLRRSRRPRSTREPPAPTGSSRMKTPTASCSIHSLPNCAPRRLELVRFLAAQRNG